MAKPAYEVKKSQMKPGWWGVYRTSNGKELQAWPTKGAAADHAKRLIARNKGPHL